MSEEGYYLKDGKKDDQAFHAELLEQKGLDEKQLRGITYDALEAKMKRHGITREEYVNL